MNQKEEALQLVYINQNRSICNHYKQKSEFELNEEALKIISKIQLPIGIISVAGAYRTGKSYLLNRVILNRQKAFDVGNTVNPCTKGLCLWNQPIKCSTSDGKPFYYFVIDSEGTGCLGADATHSSRILTLTALLSSLLIYNQMGALDEGAVQDLALLSALAQHVQLNNDDPEEYGAYFPSFLWVLRDFSLQLKDNLGNSLSPKEYMERFLALQQGITDGVEQKNRIRRLITTFFRDRDCATLVRPTNDENVLQNLSRIDFEDTRPEFIEQTIALRHKISMMVRPKSFRGTTLNGASFVALTRELVAQMNNNVRVQVEWVWDRVQKDEATAASNEAYEVYEKYIQTNVELKLPLTKEEMKLAHKRGKEAAMLAYRSRFPGEPLEQSLRELNKRFKKRVQGLAQQNEREALNQCNQFIQREFLSIQRRMNEYKSITEFERDLKLFYQFLIEHGPQTMLKQSVYLDFYHKMINEGSQMFIKHLNQDLSMVKKSQEDQTKSLESRLQQLRIEKEKEIKELNIALEKSRLERLEDQNRLKRIQDQQKDSRDEKDHFIRELQKQLDTEKKESMNVVESLKYRVTDLEVILKQTERQGLVKESEFSKQKALFEQKVNQLQSSLDDQARRGQQMDSSFLSSRSEYSTQIKEVNQKYEMIIQTLQENLDHKLLQCQQLQNQLLSSESTILNIKEKWEQRESSFMAQNQEQTLIIQRLKQEFQTQSTLDKAYAEDIRNRYEQEILTISEVCRNTESQLREKQEKHQQIRQILEKDKAMLTQKMQFYEVENTDLRQQLQTLKKNHEQTLSLLETNVKEHSKQGLNKQILELKESHLNDLRTQEQNQDNLRKKLQQQIELLHKEINESETRNLRKQNEQAKELQMIQHQAATHEEQRQKLHRELQGFENVKLKIQKECEDRLLTRFKAQEMELEETKIRYQADMRELQLKHEDQMLQLRKVYEVEKERLERRIQEERDNGDLNCQHQLEDFEGKRQEEIQQLEEEIDQLKEEFGTQEEVLQAIQNDFQNQLELKEKLIQELETQNREIKGNLLRQQDQIQEELGQQLNQQQDENIQLRSLLFKFDKDSRLKDEELQQAIQKIYLLEDKYNFKDQSFENSRNEWLNERNLMLKRVDELKTRNNDLQDEYLNKKILLEKNLALCQQHSQFLESKVNEMNSLFDAQSLKFENSLRQQLREQGDDLNDRLQRLSSEKFDLMEKNEELRQLLKSYENKMNHYSQEFQSQEHQYQERLKSYQQQFAEKEHLLQLEIQKLQSQKVDVVKPYTSGGFENIQLKQQLQALEAEKAELIASYERDTVLWQGKFEFLEDQREQAKRDLQESMSKFEQTLDFLQRARDNDRADDESSLSEVLKAVEKKYQLQLLDQQKAQEQRIQEAEEKSRFYEKEFKVLQEQIHHDQSSKVGIQTERKLNDLMEYQEVLVNEIEEQKALRESLLVEFQQRVEVEKKQWKMRMHDHEDRFKELEKKRSNMIFEHEKERAKWSLERDHLSQRLKEIHDQCGESERKRDFMVREYEKLRQEHKYCKRQSPLNSSSQQFLRKSPHKSPMEKDVNRSNISMSVAGPLNGSGSLLNYHNMLNNSTFDGMRQDNIKRSDILQNLNLNYPGESFETYYAQMVEKK